MSRVILRSIASLLILGMFTQIRQPLRAANIILQPRLIKKPVLHQCWTVLAGTPSLLEIKVIVYQSPEAKAVGKKVDISRVPAYGDKLPTIEHLSYN